MSPAAAWAVVIIGFVLPLIHVAVSRDIAAPVPGEGGTKCPFSPRMGWIVIVLFLGPLGWLMFLASRRRRRALLAARQAAGGSEKPTS